MKSVRKILLAMLLLHAAVPARAQLTDLGNGLINHPAANLTWVSDGNLFATMAAANPSLVAEVVAAWTGGDLPVGNGTSHAIVAADFNAANGTMNWFGTRAWLHYLNLTQGSQSRDQASFIFHRARPVRAGQSVVNPPPAPHLTFNPGSLVFSAQAVNSTSAARTVTITNTGTAAATLTSITTTAESGVTDNCATTLAPVASCTASVTFSPTGLETRTGTLTVAGNASASMPLSGMMFALQSRRAAR